MSETFDSSKIYLESENHLMLTRPLAICGTAAVPAILLRFGVFGDNVPDVVQMLIYGAGIVAASFVLAWAAEAARRDISGPLAIALLALVAVLPEYAVDLYYAFQSGSDHSYISYASANMNGSNRLLLGLGWPLVVLIALWAVKRRRRSTRMPTPKILLLPHDSRRDVLVLGGLALAGFFIPLTGSIPVWFGVALILVFIAYLAVASKAESSEEPEYVSVSAAIVELPDRVRKATVATMFIAAAVVILMSAEPFADALVGAGTQLGVDSYLLVQWLAPLASESPEFIVAALFALRGMGSAAIGTLIASKINQWSLLVGSLPVAHLFGGGSATMQLDSRQIEEFTLTATQTLLGVAILVTLRFHRWAAVLLVGLFSLQFVVTGVEGRYVLSIIHVVLAVGVTAWNLWHVRQAHADHHSVGGPESGEDHDGSAADSPDTSRTAHGVGVGQTQNR